MLSTDEAIERYLAASRSRGLAPGTLALYRRVLAGLAAREAALPERPEAVEAYLAAVKGAPATRRLYWRGLKTFFRWLAYRYDLDNPMLGVRAPLVRRRPMRTLALSQLAELLSAVEVGSRDAALLMLLLDTGIRIGEAAGLRPEDVAPGAITVSGKVGTRLAPISAEVEVALRAHLPWRGQRGELTRSGLQQAVKRAMARAGIVGWRACPHTLRHSFARQYLMAGGDVFSLQRIMGHSQLASTQGYVALDDQDVRYQHSRFSPLRGLARAAGGEDYAELAQKGSGRVKRACLDGTRTCQLPEGDRCPVEGAMVWSDESRKRKARECPWGVTHRRPARAAATVARGRRLSHDHG